MLDIGWAELMVIGVVALIVIGPKDLPDMFRQLGRFVAKIRSMGRDFQRAMDEAARQSGVTDVAKDLKGATSAQAMGLGGLRSAADKFEKWDPIKNAAKPTVPLKPSNPLTTTPMSMRPSSTQTAASATVPVSSLPEGSSLTAAVATEAAPVKVVGPETQALLDKQAAKATALRDYSAKLKAIDAGTLSPQGVVPPLYAPDVPLEAAEKPAKAEEAPQVKPAQVEETGNTEAKAEEPRLAAKKKADDA